MSKVEFSHNLRRRMDYFCYFWCGDHSHTPSIITGS